VALCTDTPKQIEAGQRKHGLGARMLSDRDLTVTDRFGLRNQGFHSAILVDAEGKVLWMDQSENYQRRSDPDYVLGALRSCLD